MFGIGGETELAERTLDHLSGYVGSQPVRVGNAAYDQRQNDVYGALLDSIYIHSKTREGVPETDGTDRLRAGGGGRRCAGSQPDQGIWEARGEPKHYVSSKLMCWVALDRAARLARERGEASWPSAGERRRTPCGRTSSSTGSASGACSASTTRPTRSTPRCC